MVTSVAAKLFWTQYKTYIGAGAEPNANQPFMQYVLCCPKLLNTFYLMITFKVKSTVLRTILIDEPNPHY